MSEAPSVQTGSGKVEGQARRAAVTEAMAKQFASHDGVKGPLTWSHVTTIKSNLNGWMSDYKRWALAHAGIDGYGVEISVEVEAGFGLGGITVVPTGISILWITHSDADIGDEGVEVDPLDNPHYFLYNSVGYSTGIDLGASAGVGADYFYAVRYGDAAITRDSWAGSVVSFGGEVSGKLLVGLEASGQYFSSVDYDKSQAKGTLVYPGTGWHGISYSGELESGAGLELAFERSAVEANSSVADHFGRPDVRKAIQQGATTVPEQLNKGYQRDTAGGGILSWLADWSWDVGEAVQQ